MTKLGVHARILGYANCWFALAAAGCALDLDALQQRPAFEMEAPRAGPATSPSDASARVPAIDASASAIDASAPAVDASAPELPQRDAGVAAPAIDAATPEPHDAAMPPAPDAGGGDAAVGEPPACQLDCTSFVDIPTRLTTLVNDLDAFDAETARDVRYLDLTQYANAGHGARQLDLYRDAIAYAMNALSSSTAIALPVAVDAQALLFRIRLSAYGWSPETWELAASGYPYAVVYSPSSREFPIDDAPMQRVRDRTGTPTPILQADWFFSHAMRPPLYYGLLGLPARLAELEAQLGIDIAGAIAAEQVARAGFRESGVSSWNRVIERHRLGEDRGALWLTYDFEAGSGLSNVITHPLDFRHTTSQLLFGLANGLQGYMIVDAAGARLDKAPNAAVRDPSASDFALESGLSCTSCHLESGLKVQTDEVRAATLLSASDAAESDAILALYKDDDTLQMLFAADAQRYRAALAVLRLRAFTDGSAHELDRAYAGLLTAKDIAGVLGIPESKLLAAINLSPGLFPPELLALRNPANVLPRDRFEAIFPALVGALGLGVAQAP